MLATVFGLAASEAPRVYAADPCAAPPAPPPFGAKPPAKLKGREVASPLIDAKTTAKERADQARRGLENAALAEIFQQAPGRQAGPAVARVRGVMAGNAPQGMGMRTFGGLLGRLHFFPDTSSVVRSALQKANDQGWALPKESSPADLVVARSKGPGAGETKPMRIEFLVPSAKQADFKKMTDELQGAATKYALAEAWNVGFAAAGKLAGAKPPAVSVTMDISQDFAQQLAQQKQETMQMIAASAYTAGLQKQTRRGTVQRWGIGERLATRKVTDGLVQSYSRPNNAKVQQVANVAGATVLSEVASQAELGEAIQGISQAGPGSELGLIFDPATSAAQRAQFNAKNSGEIGVRLRLANGEVATLAGATTDELAQVLGYATVHPESTGKDLTAKLAAIRKK